MSSVSFRMFVTVVIVAAMGSCTREAPLSPVTEDRVGEPSSTPVVLLGSEARTERQMKFTICHVPPGNPSNAHEITVAEAALPAHFPHGDTFGECEDEEPELCGGECADLALELDPELAEECCDARIDCTWTFDELENEVCEAVELE